MNIDAIPVLMYHSVKFHQKESWIHKHLSLTLKQFSRHLKLFNFFGLKTYFFDDLSKHLAGERKLPSKSILLSFDDGYTDNWVFAYPLLVKYKIRATFFVNPDFVDNNDQSLRPNLFDYWNGKITLDQLNECDGFINWEEMRFMEKSGYIDIQSHTMTHTKYPISDEIIDFVNPSTRIDWLYWNLFPDDKPNFLTNPKYKIPLGYPIYASQKGIIARKYTEDGTIAEATTRFVNDAGGIKFFNDPKWKERLILFADEIKQNCKNIFHRESDDEYKERLKYEFEESKKIIEHKLGKKINHLCWPFGGCDQLSINKALETGYLTTTARGEKNIFQKKYFHNVDRIAMDNPKYQNILFYPYGLYKYIAYKI